jgi:thiol-disulfide isomerase/thioredoxin
VSSRREPKPNPQPSRPWLLVLGTVGLVAVLVVVFVLVHLTTTGAGPTGAQPSASTVVASIASIPASELKQVGRGTAATGVKEIHGTPLTGPNGRPEVLYMGAEFCPYCAAERWAIIIALSRFGTFSGLQLASSSSTDVDPNTPTFTFRHATYRSPYLDFVAVEGQDQSPNLSANQQNLVSRYDSGGSIPFVDFGNRYVLVGATYDPGLLQGNDWQSIASALRQPSSDQARAIVGSASEITAALCQLSGGQPASACSP